MNIKKYIRLKAEKDFESLLTEEDKLFIQQLIQKNKEKETQEKIEKRKRKIKN